jgi:Domain of unknown function (DUF4381)
MSAARQDWRCALSAVWRAACLGALLCAAAGPVPAAAQSDGPRSATAGAASAIDDGEDIRDIRGPKTVPGAWPLAALIVGALLLAIAGLGVWRWRGRAKRARALSLAEETLQRLDAIRPLMQPSSAREFGISASEIVRTYIERRFDVVATQRTTEEFLQGLLENSHAALAAHRPLLADFLQQCDFVKFAGVSLASPDMEALFQSARKFVLETSQPAGA